MGGMWGRGALCGWSLADDCSSKEELWLNRWRILLAGIKALLPWEIQRFLRHVSMNQSHTLGMCLMRE